MGTMDYCCFDSATKGSSVAFVDDDDVVVAVNVATFGLFVVDSTDTVDRHLHYRSNCCLGWSLSCVVGGGRLLSKVVEFVSCSHGDCYGEAVTLSETIIWVCYPDKQSAVVVAMSVVVVVGVALDDGGMFSVKRTRVATSGDDVRAIDDSRVTLTVFLIERGNIVG